MIDERGSTMQEPKRDCEHNSTDVHKKKLAYRKPILKSIGSVREITASGTGSRTESLEHSGSSYQYSNF